MYYDISDKPETGGNGGGNICVTGTFVMRTQVFTGLKQSCQIIPISNVTCDHHVSRPTFNSAPKLGAMSSSVMLRLVEEAENVEFNPAQETEVKRD